MTTHPDLTTAAAYMDEAMKAIALAKQALLGGAGGALFLSSGPDLAAAEASPGNPYGSTDPDPEHAAFWDTAKHGSYGAGSAAEVAEGVEPADHFHAVWDPANWSCQYAERYATAGDAREHAAAVAANEVGTVTVVKCHPGLPALCPAQWGEPPETMLCSLSSGHDGNHATAEGIEWGGRWETAEPGAKDGAR